MRKYGISCVFSFLLFFFFMEIGLNGQTVSSIKIPADKKRTLVTYEMIHPLHRWEGKSNDVSSIIIYDKATDKITSVAALIKVASFDSQNANRDSHTIEIVEGIKYPLVTFTSTSITTEDHTLTVKGILKFHGVSQPISFPVTCDHSGKDLVVSGVFDIKMTDYRIDPPSLLGMSCQNSVKIKFTALYVLP